MQLYCGATCRDVSQVELHRKAQKKYRKTEKGLEAHRKAEQMRRYGRTKKNVADATSTPRPSDATIPSYASLMTPCCHFCGKKDVVIADFPRRAYGNRGRNTHIGRF